ncbi:type II toxin-antitoxin system YhaV family toxin [Neisseria sp.]|uniref:type II toxin-antitoxin system YhaV family toxin n=1 Tax=Neisseria sp. TaxID=192066 RepID=UPI0035A134F5
MFFRYSTQEKIIVYVWVNNDKTKRTYGSKTDAYEVFAAMLKNGNSPDSWEVLKITADLSAGLISFYRPNGR